ncbi:MAG TPA: saccharopine dehydrogenase NADP-binding domain-containing protein [Blastocatellia bacterium]|nr:saccharopine dehydrogenase NADP-binding domain-containing protein [Blastocatellia bacterium]
MITLIGATGFTGTLIAHEIHRLGISARLAARDEHKLERLNAEAGGCFDLATVDVTDPASVERALDGASVVINCAGPFTDLGEPVVSRAVRRGIHYVDTTGEQGFIKTVYDKYDDEARSNGIALVPACAFEYALGDAATGLAVGTPAQCDSLEITYSATGIGMSRGTKKSVIRAMSSDAFRYRDGKLVKQRPGENSVTVEIPGVGKRKAYSFPGGEVLMAPRHIEVRDVTTFMVFGVPRFVLASVERVAALASGSAFERWLVRRIDRGSFGPSPKERQRTLFTIVCAARRGNQSRTVTVAGRDPYGITAAVAVRVASILEHGDARSLGGVSPSMVAGAQPLIEETERLGVKWDLGEWKNRNSIPST